MKYFIITFFLISLNIFSQSERYTKGAENGYAWLKMDDPALRYSTSKDNYLSSILDRIRLTKEKHPEIESLGCKEDISKMTIQEKSNQISMADVVGEINEFYLVQENLVIPIVFAYCYTIKKLAGVSSEELNVYKKEVLLFCYE